MCARTDAISIEGMKPLLERCKAYIDAGVDMIYPEGLLTLEEFTSVATELKTHKKSIYLLANKPMVVDSFSDFQDLGYSCVIYPAKT